MTGRSIVLFLRFAAVPFLVGTWSLAGQFVYNRIIFFYIANSENAAASIISLHLLGFLIGSFIAKRCAPPITGLVALCLVLTPLSQLLIWTMGVEAFGLIVTLILILLFAFLLAATSGLLLVRLMESRQEHHSASGIVIADSLGSVLGAVIGGFFLVPKLGLAASFGFIAALQAAGLILAILPSLKQRSTLAALACVLFAGTVMATALTQVDEKGRRLITADGLPLSYVFDGQGAVMHQERTPFGVLSVVQAQSWRHLLIDTRPLCAVNREGSPSATSQWFEGDLMGKLAAEGDGAPEFPRIAMVGLGCGTTLAGLLNQLPKSEGTQVEVIDVNPGIRLVQAYFKELLPFTIDDPRVELIIRDGYSHFTAPPDARLYDAIMMDVVWMQNMNATHLFSQEMFENARDWLTPRGVFSVWTEQSNPFSPVSLIIYRTLKEVFPLVYIDTSFGTVLFIASKNLRPELEAMFRDTQKTHLWVEDASRNMPVNRLNDLPMNSYRFDALGQVSGEDLKQEYEMLFGLRTVQTPSGVLSKYRR
jgi:spermidine synthase